VIRRRALLAAAPAAPGLARAQGLTQAWPTRPVRIVVPDAPGGGNDTTIRIFASHLEGALGQPVPVDNRPGAGGRIGVEHAFRSPADGTTLLLGNAGSNGINAALYRDLPYDLERDFVPVSLLVTGPNALVVNPRVFPVNTVPELIAAIRARPPGHYNYATAGAGSSAHFSAELFKAMTGVDLVHVPFRGAAGMAQAVVQGDAPFLIANMVNVMPFVRRGEIRLLAVTSLERWPDTPDVPTLHESGLPGFETIAWNGLFGPPGLPPAVVARLLPELQRIGRLPDVVERIKLIGGQVVTSPPEVLAARVRADIAKWRELSARANIRIE
jgi:tripartite-type tricarboxylate transporter receptor subunit TctC